MSFPKKQPVSLGDVGGKLNNLSIKPVETGGMIGTKSVPSKSSFSAPPPPLIATLPQKSRPEFPGSVYEPSRPPQYGGSVYEPSRPPQYGGSVYEPSRPPQYGGSVYEPSRPPQYGGSVYEPSRPPQYGGSVSRPPQYGGTVERPCECTLCSKKSAH